MSIGKNQRENIQGYQRESQRARKQERNSNIQRGIQKGKEKETAGHYHQSNGYAVQGNLPAGTQRMDLCKQEERCTQTHLGEKGDGTPMGRNKMQGKHLETHHIRPRERRHKRKDQKLRGGGKRENRERERLQTNPGRNKLGTEPPIGGPLEWRGERRTTNEGRRKRRGKDGEQRREMDFRGKPTQHDEGNREGGERERRVRTDLYLVGIGEGGSTSPLKPRTAHTLSAKAAAPTPNPCPPKGWRTGGWGGSGRSPPLFSFCCV